MWTPLLPQGVALSAVAWSPPQTHSLPSSLPVKSSGAIWIGVPTMLPDIMASGLQNPKSVILARFCLSSCQQSRVRVALCLILHTALHSVATELTVGVYLTAIPHQPCPQPPCLQLHSCEQPDGMTALFTLGFPALSMTPGTIRSLTNLGRMRE